MLPPKSISSGRVMRAEILFQDDFTMHLFAHSSSAALVSLGSNRAYHHNTAGDAGVRISDTL